MGLSVPAQAHRVSTPTSQVLANPRSGQWEITHRLSAHDVETAFLQAGEDIAGLFDTQEGLARVRDYVSARFTVVRRAGPLALTFVGAEIEGEWVYVYFELAGVSEPVVIENRLLFEVEPLTGLAATQALLNVRDGEGKVQTGIFTPTKSRQRLDLCFADCTK